MNEEANKLRKLLKKATHLTKSEKEFWDIMIFDYEYTPILMKKLGRYNE